MIIYLNQYNETIWHNKKNCEQDLDECFGTNLGEGNECSFSIMQNAIDICEAIHNKNYAYAGEAMANMIQLYEEEHDKFYNDFYATVEADNEKMKNEITNLLELGYTWGYEECDAED